MVITLEEARHRAKNLFGQLASGIDPIKARHQPDLMPARRLKTPAALAHCSKQRGAYLAPRFDARPGSAPVQPSRTGPPPSSRVHRNPDPLSWPALPAGVVSQRQRAVTSMLHEKRLARKITTCSCDI